ncbi:ABC transporter substrate-binding protein [Culicoidibacter larvae]|uniref:ABC transporter substrate-binding protein n=1 Tax=Culicoidibacter larvae TaxID=2579976 RepID=A0A5R8QH08_9FIRM|nr:ABC transporter substrate-binding protein [Culicoidibacter larvae]TLG77262.1 ABC transporter substrate-binding protein [Culicoidibacter larvae]
MKKLLSIGAIILLTASALAGCAGGNTASDGTVRIGILQLISHPSLDAAREGFLEALAEAGYVEGENLEIDYQNAQGDQANLKSMSERLTKNNDLVLAIATPAAQALVNEGKDVPIMITAVTDPVDAGLVQSMEAPGGTVSGTSDMVPIEKQAALLMSIVPNAKTVGILYNSSETNSQIQADLAKTALEAAGVTVKELTVTSTNDVQQVTETLAKQVDAIYIPTDNTLASSMPTVASVVEKYNVPVIPGSTDQVETGGLATFGINYHDLGKQTGEMAVKVLKGEATPATMPVETSQKLQLVINRETAEKIGIDPDSIVAPN